MVIVFYLPFTLYMFLFAEIFSEGTTQKNSEEKLQMVRNFQATKKCSSLIVKQFFALFELKI